MKTMMIHLFFLKQLKNLYFYDKGYTTRYTKFVKIIDYKTYYYDILFGTKSSMTQSTFLEDIDDTSKLKVNEDKNNTSKNKEEFLGSFRLSLSKKKDIFIRTYPDLLSDIGGHIVSIFGFIGIVYIIFVRYIDNIRIFDSIKKESVKIHLNEVINKDNRKNNDFNNYNDEICCCCCSCCYENEENNQNNNLINENYDYNIDDITCENKWHYFFYKISRLYCKKKKSKKKNDESCRQSFCNLIYFIISFIINFFCSLFCFCERCSCN